MSEKEKEICDFDTSSETQGQIVGARESLNGRKKLYEERGEEFFPFLLPLGLRG